MKQITDMKSYSKGFEHGKKAEWFKLVNTFIEDNFWVMYDLDIIFGEENKNPDLFLDKLTELENYSSNHIKDKNNMDDNYKYGYEEGIKKCKAEVAICLMNIFDSPELSKRCEKKVESELNIISKYADISENEVKILRNKKNRIITWIEKTKEKKWSIQMDREREKRKANPIFYFFIDNFIDKIRYVMLGVMVSLGALLLYFFMFKSVFGEYFTLRYFFIPVILWIRFTIKLYSSGDFIDVLKTLLCPIVVLSILSYVMMGMKIFFGIAFN